MRASHARDPGSIPGQCSEITFFLEFSRTRRKGKNMLENYYVLKKLELVKNDS